MKTNIYPELHPQESFRGYLIRLRQINGIELKPAKTRRSVTAEEIQLLNKISDELLKALSERLPIDIKREERRYEHETTSCFNYQISRGLITSKRRVCPHCINEAPYQRLSWEIILFNTCTVHNTYLVERCDCCYRQLSWTDLFICRCRCGFDLRNSRAIQAQNFVALSEQITQLELPKVNSEWCPYPLELRSILGLGIDEVLRLVSFLRDSSLIEDYALVLRDTAQLISPAQQLLADALAHWPTGFTEVCTKIFEHHMHLCGSNAKSPTYGFRKRLFQRYPTHFLIDHPAGTIYRTVERLIAKKYSSGLMQEVA